MVGTLRNWLTATAATIGVVGGGAAGLSLAGESQTAKQTPAPTVAKPDLGAVAALDAQVRQLAAEDRALKLALKHARGRLTREMRASEHSLSVVRQQLAAARSALATARSAQATATAAAPAGQSSAGTSYVAPATHTTSGASGSGTSSSGDDGGEGGDD